VYFFGEKIEKKNLESTISKIKKYKLN